MFCRETLLISPRHDDARNKIRRFDRDDIVEELIKNYLKDNGVNL